MAGRFVSQRLASWVCRSRSHVGPHAAGAPVTPAASEGGIRTYTNRIHHAAVHPGSAVAKNFVVSPSSGAAKISPLDAALAEIKENAAEFNKFMRIQAWMWGFTFFNIALGVYLDEQNRKESSRGSRCSSCRCQGSKS